MEYNCVCEKCNKVTVVDTEKQKIGIGHNAYVTCYGYLNTRCIHCGKMEAYALWRGMNGNRHPRTGILN